MNNPLEVFQKEAPEVQKTYALVVDLNTVETKYSYIKITNYE